jgi:transcriptional regulator with XRE-family HTH domain
MNAPTTTNAPTFGERLARARMWAGLSQEDIAERLDLHERSVANYETGRRMPRTDVTVAWAMICGVDVALLVEPLTTTRRAVPGQRSLPFHSAA